MANTFASATVIDGISEQVITTLGNVFAPLRAFSRDYSAEPMNENSYVQVKKFTAGSTTLINPGNYESGDTTHTNVAVQLKHYVNPWHITASELNQSQKLMDAVAIQAQQLGNKIIDVALAPVTATNFPTNVTIAQASFSAANVKTLWAAVAKSPTKSLFLDSTALSVLLPSDLNGFKVVNQPAFGFDGIYLHTRWNGAGTNIYGFAAGAEAIATASRVPFIDPSVANQAYAVRNIELPGLAGLTVQLVMWGSLATRASWASLGVMFGSALGDNTAGAHVKSA